ncbi:hypothetical protein LOTGIDRAFT_163039 [Lottia gigantea]|uniref:Uncharacterized protein n=1 Tax=Lottia gigantea TaxID=225164 RepID=V4BSN9_LOTGI|nr:hypothetical protein LOTGIDRAFT_163039 [Lottia gigantea]ESO92034.1 hypothetical protein LOTGIDRAFT_163039 [Lottia gigantea]
MRKVKREERDEEDIASLRTEGKDLKIEVQELNIKDEVIKIQEDVRCLKKGNNELKSKLDVNENYTKQKNIILYGLKETPSERYEDCERLKDRDYILKCSRAYLKSIQNNQIDKRPGDQLSISEDYTLLVRMRRKALIPKLIEAKEANTEKSEGNFEDDFENFRVFETIRKCEQFKASDSVVLLVKKNLASLTERIVFKTDYEEMIWIRLGLKKFGRPKNLIVGIVYIPPEGSIFYNDKNVNCGVRLLGCALYEIENMYPSDDVIILGDLNSRIGRKQDFVEEAKTKHNPFLQSFYESSVNEATPVQRNSKDNQTNTFGNQLIELCCDNDFIILNGRTPGDPLGNYTYVSSTGASVIDLALVKPRMLSDVSNFTVLDTDISKHFPISCSISFGETSCQDNAL